MTIFQKVKSTFSDLRHWWGDHLDVRTYLYVELQKLENQKVLDVGCGTGNLMPALSDSNRVYGTEMDPHAATLARQLNPRADVRLVRTSRLPFAKRFFDVVVCAHVIEVVPASERAVFLREIHRVLKPRGLLLLTTPNNARYRSTKLDRRQLQTALSALFDADIREWNPLPDFPYFLPARLLSRIPGMFGFLSFLMDRRWFVGRVRQRLFPQHQGGDIHALAHE